MSVGKIKLTYEQNNQAEVEIQADLELRRSEIDTNSEKIKNAGRSTRKRGRGHIVDELNLNVCLCGSVVDPLMEGAVKCKRSSCETQWVSKI